jgi:hypothetical protein
VQVPPYILDQSFQPILLLFQNFHDRERYGSLGL